MLKRLTAGLAVLALGLTACGTTEDPEPAAQQSGTTPAQPVSVTDFRGKKIDLKAPATRVVVLEWGAAESLATLGVTPVGVADTKGYGAWVTAVKLDGSVKDVGSRNEVSVDSVLGLDPDLIIAVSGRPDPVVTQLEKSVPVMVLRGSDAKDPIGQVKTNLELIGKAVGKSEQATAEIAALDKKIADGKQAIAAAGKGGQQFTMADGYKQGSTISIRMYATGSLLGNVLTQMGLKNGWTAAGDPDYGLAQTDVEGLTKLKDVNFLYIANKSDGGDVFGEDLAKNAIWKGLPFVKAGTVHRLPDGIWMFGGPRSTEQFIDAAVKVFTSDPDSARPAPVIETAPVRRVRVATVFVLGTVAAVLLAGVHLTQGTSGVDAGDLLRLLTGGRRGETDAAAVLVASRLPRLLAGVLVGVALGIAGALLQSLARNPLAAPDTLGVNAGAYVAVVIVAAFGSSLGVLQSGAVAFVGGLATAFLVLALSSAGASGPTRLILAGSAVSLALGALTTLFLLLFEEETIGVFAWGSGTLVQTDLHAVTQMAPVVAVGIVLAMLIAARLDILALGDDTAQVLGVTVRRTRTVGVIAAVLLSAAAVTVAGPIAFVGLVAPVLVRLIAPVVPGLSRHRVLLPAAALSGVLVVIGSDVLLRLVLGAQAGVEIPTGIVTMVTGAAVLVWLARRIGGSDPVRRPHAATGGLRDRRAFVVVTVVLVLLLCVGLVLAVLAGDRWLLTGDVVNRLNGRSGRAVTFVLEHRLPRVGAAVLSGAALAIAGTAVQAVCRNPLAEPGILGITGGAGVGAVLVLVLVPSAGIWWLTAAAAAAALATFALVYGLSWRGGLSSDRLVLVGIGMSSAAVGIITFLIVYSDPWNIALALTWLSGSTNGRTGAQLIPVAVALLVITPLTMRHSHDLDLMSIDDDVPRVLGVRLERTRLMLLCGAALLTAAAVSAIGVVGFVGLVAPHAARALVGGRNSRVLPVAALLGAVLVSFADTLGRTVIAPAQVPAGLVTALLGTPYFVWLLWRSRA